MTDLVRVASAAVRAHVLLAERHQPLTMTPGDVRALLARYQRCLQELADAVEPVTAVQLSPQQERKATALFHLRAHWQDDYYIKLADSVWSASPLRDRAVILTAGSSEALKILIRNDYAKRQLRKR